jgi:predicted  nucleic acid-binding Zn-ribbon protein
MQFGQYMTQMESWRDAMADGKIDPDELQQQARRVEDLLRAFESKINDAQHEELTKIFFELAVFYGMERIVDLAALGGQD